MTNLPLTSRDSANRGAESPAPIGRWRTLARWLFATSWIVNGLLLVAGSVFVYRFGQSRDVIERVLHSFASGDWWTSSDHDGGIHLLCVRTLGAMAVAGCTLIAAFASLWVGGPRFRSTRMWLVFTALVAGWLGLVVAWPEIYWRGQQRRVAAVLATAESTVRDLNAHWPQEEGELPAIGAFLAYPKGNPAILMALGDAQFSDTAIHFTAVERTGEGVMRFQLTGDEADAWLEWRGDDSPPQPFEGGLETNYTVERQQRLAPQWYLVRYVFRHLAPWQTD